MPGILVVLSLMKSYTHRLRCLCQHKCSALPGAGRVGVVVPHGVLFRGGAEGKIRQKLEVDVKAVQTEIESLEE